MEHSRPDIDNAMRKLLKANDGENITRYGLDTTKFDLKLKLTMNANKPWEMVYFSDSNYAGIW